MLPALLRILLATTPEDMALDAYTMIGFRLFVGLALTAGGVVLLVLVANVPWWAGLVLLAVLDALEIGWAYGALRRMRPHRG